MEDACGTYAYSAESVTQKSLPVCVLSCSLSAADIDNCCTLQEAGVSDDSGSGLSRGLGSWVQNKLSGNAGVVLEKVIAATLDAVDGPLQVRHMADWVSPA